MIEKKKIVDVWEIYCDYNTQRHMFDCRAHKEITTLGGNKIDTEQLGDINRIEIGSSAVHETEIFRSPNDIPSAHVYFTQHPITCIIEEKDLGFGLIYDGIIYKKLKCIDEEE